MRLGLGHYRQNQNASSTTKATVVCITNGMSIVNRFIGSAAETALLGTVKEPAG